MGFADFPSPDAQMVVVHILGGVSCVLVEV